jgi:hypothetical protein
MKLLLDSFWRASAYCLHPKVVLLSLMPLVVLMGVTGALGYFYWQPSTDAIDAFLQSSSFVNTLWALLENIGLSGLKAVLAPLLLLLVVTPVVVMGTLLLVSWLMAPALVDLVARRRFAHLQRLEGASFFLCVGWSLVSLGLALLAMLVSAPMWLVPPLVLVLPPLIWGWLTYRVMAFDALASHASANERHSIFMGHRLPLLAMGVVCGMLGAAPSIVWSVGFMAIAMAPILVPLSIWIYTLIFTFSSLWFAHYGLSVLDQLRSSPTNPATETPSDEVPLVSLGH